MSEFTHFDASGAARMVSVGKKENSARLARAEAIVRMQPETLRAIRDGGISKGNVCDVARLAGIMAAKRTDELIPLCHSLGLDAVNIDFEEVGTDGLRIESCVTVQGRTGVEMEALMAVSIAALTVYDMCKSRDRGIEMTGVRLLEKSGGKSGHFLREKEALTAVVPQQNDRSH